MGVYTIVHLTRPWKWTFMMTSSNGDIFFVTGLLWGNPSVPGWFPYQRPATLSFDVFIMCARRNGWANSLDDSALRHRSSHVTVMWTKGLGSLDIFMHLCLRYTWWRHQMETFSASLAICVGNSPIPGEFPAQRSVTRSFDVFFDLRLNKRLSKQS